ncbi:S1 family peptidase [Mucilaginibacter myungsuensis]|uniref:Trypsin-like peptidase domain-containing protein n=1 Tax=Mucilaginibacter myungsuensis TaxID=649104 RepID=A0A929PY36_9SPHI|nr:serine protease [Mucilaginibacter myungsuensis]MBE9663769.1 trypsin-like peptidase domain-containing protein [Mucilaginibacter myungsuensis]MDN3598905.1 serine protease [Mucilaginibacter myungsuensis]
MKKILLLTIGLFCLAVCKGQTKNEATLPVSTQMTISKANIFNQNNEILNVFLIANLTNQSVGTGFLLHNGQIITNEHVVRNGILSQIALFSPNGQRYGLIQIAVDTVRDLAILTPSRKILGGFDLGDDSAVSIGNQTYTWGFPLGYNGPSPLLSVGYLAGINTIQPYPNKTVKHLVVNGAFNPGNSGGPLIVNGKVIGVVQSKAAPITPVIASALKALLDNKSGMMYTNTDATGKQTSVSEAQVIGQILLYYRELAQVMIGEAVTVSELKNFLNQNNIKGY